MSDIPYEPFYAAFYPETWDEARHIGARLHPTYIFRGQASYDWPLSTNIERSANRAGLPHMAVPDQEQWILHEFSRRVHHYLPNVRSTADPLELLALLQHHGGPTRLLDFTYSFHVAAFFAVEHASSGGAIWAVSLKRLGKRLAVAVGNHAGAKDRRVRNAHNASYCSKCLAGERIDPLVLDVEPLLMNERMHRQQGVFLFPTRVDMPFLENLFQTFGVSAQEATEGANIFAGLDDNVWPAVAQIYLPDTEIGNALHELAAMNITAETLFGGLDGLARSYHRYLQMSTRYWTDPDPDESATLPPREETSPPDQNAGSVA